MFGAQIVANHPKTFIVGSSGLVFKITLVKGLLSRINLVNGLIWTTLVKGLIWTALVIGLLLSIISLFCSG